MRCDGASPLAKVQRRTRPGAAWEERPESSRAPASTCRARPQRPAGKKNHVGVREVRFDKEEKMVQKGRRGVVRSRRKQPRHGGDRRSSGDKIRRPGGTNRKGGRGQMERRRWGLREASWERGGVRN